MTDWPDLTQVSYVSGRLANEADVQAGHAVFVLTADARAAGAAPLELDVPQYAVYNDAEKGTKSPVVVIQAEMSQGSRIVGAQYVDREGTLVGLFEEFTLLGTDSPAE